MLTEAIGVRSTPAKISIQSQNAQVEIHNQAAELTIDSGPAGMNISTTPLQLQIDSTVPRQECGYYTPLALSQDLANYSNTQAQRAVAARNADGAALQHIENGGGAFGRLARQNEMAQASSHEFIVTMIPRTPPAIYFTPGQVNLDIQPRQTQVQITARPPMITVRAEQRSIDVTPASLRLFVREPDTLDLNE
jgi:hypothetical protein